MDIQDYISVFTQAPLAVILIAYIYFSDRQRNRFHDKMFSMFKDITARQSNTIDELTKIIKQQERKQ